MTTKSATPLGGSIQPSGIDNLRLGSENAPTSGIDTARLGQSYLPLALDLGSKNMAKNAPDTGLFKYMTPKESMGAGLGGVGAGLAVDTQSTSYGDAGFDVLGAMVSGGITGSSGGLYGALIGAGVGGIVGAGKAYFGVSQARKQKRAQKELRETAERAQQESIRKSEEWAMRSLSMQLADKEQNRNDALIRQSWMDYQNKLTQMNTFMNENRQGGIDLLSLLQPVGT